MNDVECGRVRELIPDFVSSRLGHEELELVEQHVGQCAECRAELELAQVILAGRPEAPEGLFERITLAVEADRRTPARTWWGVSAAAIAVLALGIGITSERTTDPPIYVPGFASEVEEGDIWLSGDGLMAGAPLFDGLSDDALIQLLEELSVGASGGAA